MFTAVRRVLYAVLMAAGIVVLGSQFSTASADTEVPDTTTAAAATAAADEDQTSGEDGVLSGNQTDSGVETEVDVTGNQVTVIGDGNESSSGDGSAEASITPGGDSTSGDDGAGSGNQSDAVVEADVDVSCNQVTVVGDDNTASGECSDSSAGTSGSDGGDSTSGEDGAGSGNQVDSLVTAPVEVEGNQVTVLGDGNETSTEEPDGAGGSGNVGDGAGEDGADEVAGVSGGGGRMPGAAVLTLPTHDGSTGVLPQTGASATLALLVTGGVALAAGVLLLMAGRRRRWETVT